MRRFEPRAEGHGTGVSQSLSILVARKQITAVFLKYVAELRRIFLLEYQQRRVVGESFGNPLIVITLPLHQIAPPLMRGLVHEHLRIERSRQRVEAEIRLLLRTEKGEARKKYESRPSLA